MNNRHQNGTSGHHPAIVGQPLVDRPRGGSPLGFQLARIFDGSGSASVTSDPQRCGTESFEDGGGITWPDAGVLRDGCATHGSPRLPGAPICADALSGSPPTGT